MKRIPLAIVAALLLLPATAQAATDKTGKVEIGKPFTWAGTQTVGLNVAHYWGPVATGTCTHDPHSYCETLLIEFSNPLSQEEIDQGKTSKSKSATITIDNFAPVPDPVTDFDLVVFDSDAQGTKGAEIGRSADFGPDQGGDESVALSIRTTITQPSVFVYVDVVYFVVLGTGYTGTATF